MKSWEGNSTTTKSIQVALVKKYYLHHFFQSKEQAKATSIPAQLSKTYPM